MNTVVKRYGLRNAVLELIKIGEEEIVICEHLIQAGLYHSTKDNGKVMVFKINDEVIEYEVLNRQFKKEE